ncbi:SCO family protein [Burkholderia pyrrocinia]|uniref:SCO family protein n=1 Tax=Burkholderia pyrrocinia TaxID=60550 RepID=UPI00326356F4
MPQDYRGNVLLLLFDILSCQGIDSATMLETARAKKLFGEQEGKVKVAFVTLDSSRDTRWP